MTETPKEAYERLLRETRLGQQIEELARFLDFERDRPGLGVLLSKAQLRILIDQLRELRARRLAMGREPDDQVNAAVDMCCCGSTLQRWRALRELGYCVVHSELGPRLRCGAFRLRDCSPAIEDGCPQICGPADEAFPF